MDAVAALQDNHIPKIFQPTLDIFRPLLEASRSQIEKINRATFKYGPTDRHQLDVYYPPEPARTKEGKTPILWFTYGGGFFEGQRAFPPPHDLGYTNLGAYFAKRGFIVIIADYRLVPHIKFPEPVEDLCNAFVWIISNADKVFIRSAVEPDLNQVFWMGHSAGSDHIVTLMLYPGLLPDDLRTRIRGLILKGGAYRHVPAGDFGDEIIAKYYGSWDDAEKLQPVGLLETAPDGLVKSLPDVLLLASEREENGFWDVNVEFSSLLTKKAGKNFAVHQMKGHNHISPHWALFSGQGEQWAEDVLNWIHSRY